MALITIKVENTPATGRAAVLAAWAQVPDDVVASGNSYIVAFDHGTSAAAYQMGTDVLALPTKTTGPANTIKLRCSAGHSFRDNPNVKTNRYAYVPANGAALTFNNADRHCLVIDSDYVEVDGLQVANTYGPFGGGTVILVTKPTSRVINCIAESAHHSVSSIGVECQGDILNTLNISRAAYSVGFKYGANSLVENCMAVRVSDRVNGGGFGFTTPFNNGILHNCASFNFDKFSEYDNVQFGSNNATDRAIMPFGANSKANLVYADQFVSTTGDLDFRTKAGSALIDAGSAPDESNLGDGPSGPRQQGVSVDIGSWEFPSTLQSPTATVTNIAVTGRKVVISGTTTGAPTSLSTISLVPTSREYNGAVARDPIPLTLGTGVFSAEFDLLMVGEYDIAIVVANSAYSVPGNNPLGAFQVVGPSVTSLTQELDVQVLRVFGTVAGNPTSGTFVLPAADIPNGAADQSYSVTITGSNYKLGTDGVVVPPGDYKRGVLRFTNASGTSFPADGTRPISIIGIDGNPQAPDDTPAPADTVAPTMVGAITVSAQTTTGFTLTWPAATDAVGVAYYEVDNGSGAYVNVGNVLTLAVTGKTPSTTYPVRVRALDAAGNAATPLTASAVTTAAADTIVPVFTGTVSVANATSTTATISWSAASDNVAVTGYEYSLDGGTTYINAGSARTANLASLTPNTAYALRVRAYDAAGNRSAPIQGSFTTSDSTVTPDGFVPSVSRTVRVFAGRNVFEAGAFWSISGNNSPVGSKDPNSTIDIHFDWTNWLADIGGAELSAVDFILSPELISVAGVPTTTGGTVFVSGGSLGQNMSITCRITTATTPPRIEDRTVVLQIKEQ